MQEPQENRFCSLLLFEVQEINHLDLKICYQDPQKSLWASQISILETRASNVNLDT